MTSLSSALAASPRQWQTSQDLDHRREILARLLAFGQIKNTTTNVTVEGQIKYSNLARQLELVLYQSAYSFEEYQHLGTLERRVQSLVLQLMGRRRRSSSSVHQRNNKRLRTSRQSPQRPNDKRARVSRESAAATSLFLLNNQRELIAHIYQYLDGTEIHRHLSINRYTAVHLKSCITSFHLSLSMFTQRQSPQLLLEILTGAPELSTLRLLSGSSKGPISCSSPSSEQTTTPRLPTKLVSSEDLVNRESGATLVRVLAQALDAGACANLKTLDLEKLYSGSGSRQSDYCQQERLPEDTTSKLVQALRHNVKGLESLALGANVLGDIQAVEIAAWLSECQSLQHLSLRDNFVGQRGATALFHAMMDCEAFEELDLRGNLLTDVDGQMLERVLKTRRSKLRKIHLANNYFERNSTLVAQALNLQERVF